MAISPSKENRMKRVLALIVLMMPLASWAQTATTQPIKLVWHKWGDGKTVWMKLPDNAKDYTDAVDDLAIGQTEDETDHIIGLSNPDGDHLVRNVQSETTAGKMIVWVLEQPSGNQIHVVTLTFQDGKLTEINR
jgi:hypothetical protein